ncbi:MAG: hypothetical protein H6828_15685 [Planctomycetes bacterium]|nr:hypothetical protein [Planctomycetota bacterium]
MKTTNHTLRRSRLSAAALALCLAPALLSSCTDKDADALDEHLESAQDTLEDAADEAEDVVNDAADAVEDAVDEATDGGA